MFSHGSIFALTNAHFDGALLHGNPYNVDSTEISVRFPAMLGRWVPLPSTLPLSYKSTFFLFVLHAHAIVPEDLHALPVEGKMQKRSSGGQIRMTDQGGFCRGPAEPIS